MIFVGDLATAVLSAGDAFCAHGITRSIPIRSVLVEESLLKARISEALMLYFAEIPEMVSHLAILCTTHETGGILIIIPGLRVVRSPSFAHRIASILTSYLSESLARVSPAWMVYLRIVGDFLTCPLWVAGSSAAIFASVPVYPLSSRRTSPVSQRCEFGSSEKSSLYAVMIVESS